MIAWRCPGHSKPLGPDCPSRAFTTALLSIGALIIRIGFWDTLYYKHNKEPKNSIGIKALELLLKLKPIARKPERALPLKHNKLQACRFKLLGLKILISQPRDPAKTQNHAKLR